MIRFSIFGIPVLVQPFFWITLAIVGGAGSANSASAIFDISLFILAGFISVLVHELGHALMARKFGAYSEVTLEAFGGYAAYSGVRLTRPQSFAVTAAGPAIQFLLGAAVMYLLPYLPPMNTDALYFLGTLVWISIAWALINLLPVLPLDGGRLLDAILGPERIKVTLWVSIIVAVVVGVAMFSVTRRPLFPLFLAMFGWQSWQALQASRRR